MCICTYVFLIFISGLTSSFILLPRVSLKLRASGGAVMCLLCFLSSCPCPSCACRARGQPGLPASRAAPYPARNTAVSILVQTSGGGLAPNSTRELCSLSRLASLSRHPETPNPPILTPLALASFLIEIERDTSCCLIFHLTEY